MIICPAEIISPFGMFTIGAHYLIAMNPRGMPQFSDADELFAQLTTTPVGPEREEIVKRLNDINVQEYFQIPLVHRGSQSAKINGLEGVRMNGGWESEMWNIEEWYRE